MASTKELQVPKRRARNSLSEELILDTALRIVAEGQTLSIRVVADKLNCSPMALYRHFPNKQSLVLALIDRVMEEMPLNPVGETWEERVLSWASSHLQTLQANPWAISLLMDNPDPGRNVRMTGETLLQELGASKQPEERVIATFSAILALNYGWAGFTANARTSANRPRPLVSLGPHAPNAQELPNTAHYWMQITKVGTPEQHQVAVTLLISGLVANQQRM
jgi:AcrR family transcriptional regulator